MPAPLPRLLAVGDGSGGDERSPAAWTAWLAALAAAGVDGVQLRAPWRDDRELYDLARAAVELPGAPSSIWINGRADLALAAGCGGVQLPVRGMPLAPLRRRFATRLRFGASTHTLDEVRRRRDEGADIVIFGPVFATPSKEGIFEPRGLERLAEAVAIGVPVLAIGGIDAPRAAAVAATGAHGIAAIRLFADPVRDAVALATVRALWPAA
ncbi:MAG: thiamine phosphate synthase [Thermoanaerobaculia bacterium]